KEPISQSEVWEKTSHKAIDFRTGKGWEKLGKNDKPKIGSEKELDDLVAAGGIEVFRGLASSGGAGSGKKYADEFRKGNEPPPSAGLTGKGYYTTPDVNTAQAFSRVGGTAESQKI